MTTPVIVRTEKYIPRNGGPVVFQVIEEVEIGDRWISLDPRNPTPEEVQSFDDKAIANQKATIDSLTAERDSLTKQLSAMTTERDTALSEKVSLQAQLDMANATVETLHADKGTLETANAELTSERDTAVSQLEVANERITTLESRIAELTAEPEVPIVSRRQARLALLQLGYFEQVESAVYAGPKGIQIEYEADVWRRDNPTLVAMAEQLGMNAEKIDQFFTLAGTL
jgi:hypothetical protein